VRTTAPRSPCFLALCPTQAMDLSRRRAKLRRFLTAGDSCGYGTAAAAFGARFAVDGTRAVAGAADVLASARSARRGFVAGVRLRPGLGLFRRHVLASTMVVGIGRLGDFGTGPPPMFGCDRRSVAHTGTGRRIQRTAVGGARRRNRRGPSEGRRIPGGQGITAPAWPWCYRAKSAAGSDQTPSEVAATFARSGSADRPVVDLMRFHEAMWAPAQTPGRAAARTRELTQHLVRFPVFGSIGQSSRRPPSLLCPDWPSSDWVPVSELVPFREPLDIPVPDCEPFVSVDPVPD
jgi:hypothetical protein